MSEMSQKLPVVVNDVFEMTLIPKCGNVGLHLRIPKTIKDGIPQCKIGDDMGSNFQPFLVRWPPTIRTHVMKRLPVELRIPIRHYVTSEGEEIKREERKTLEFEPWVMWNPTGEVDRVNPPQDESFVLKVVNQGMLDKLWASENQDRHLPRDLQQIIFSVSENVKTSIPILRFHGTSPAARLLHSPSRPCSE